jgi:hypothetical protein
MNGFLPQQPPQGLPETGGGQADHTPAWMEWLKKPENLMTGIVLAAGLAQGRSREGQSDAGVVGERVLGALAFRGGLDAATHQRNEQKRELDSRVAYQQGTLRQGEQQIETQRAGQRLTASEGQANRAHAAQLANTPRPQTEAERQETLSRAGYYDRMPQARVGGDGEKDGLFEDMYEQKIFEQWAQGEMTQGRPLDIMKWAQIVQPYRNARLQMKIMADQGLLGELTQGADGQWKVVVRGVADPTASQPTPGNEPPVELTPESVPPSDLAGLAEQNRQRRAEQEASAAEAKRLKNERNRAPSAEEMARYQADLKDLTEQQLQALSKRKDTPLDQVRAIRVELQRRYKAAPPQVALP